MQKLEVEAVYENGTLKLSHPLPLQDGQKVTVTLQPTGGAVEHFYGIVRWTRDPQELHRFLEGADEGQ